MDVLDELAAKFGELDRGMVNEVTNFQETSNTLERYLEDTRLNVAAFKKTGDGSVFDKQIKDFTTKGKGGRKKKITTIAESAENSLKENTPLEDAVKMDENDARPRRRAFNEASQIMNTQRRTTRNTKNSEATFNAIVKMERLSVEETPIEKLLENVKIKVEMPPPAAPPVKRNRKKKDTDSSRTKSVDRSSDVILQKEEIPIVNLEDDEEDKEVEESTKRSTRTKTKKQKEAESAKRLRSPSVEKKRTAQKRTKRKKSSPEREVESSTYEDAREAPESESDNFGTPDADVTKGETSKARKNNLTEQFVNQPAVILEQLPQKLLEKLNTATNTPPHVMNATIVLNKMTPPVIANETVVIEKVNETMVISKTPDVVQIPKEIAAIMTDDESINENVEAPKKPIKNTKPIFSPFTNSPVKKRVEAFEKLQQQQTAPDDLPRPTRTKTRQKTKKEGYYEEKEEGRKVSQIPVKDKKSTLLTPTIQSRYLPSSVSQSTMVKRFGDSTEHLAVPKSSSALKACQQEFRERERKRKEKEAEAMRKKEALMQLQIEQKRRKREEKELKAKQQREAIEKEKLKLAEMQAKQREERQRQLMAEKQEKLQKEREEVERKRLMVKQKYDEKKRAEEEEKRSAEEARLKAEKAAYKVEKQGNEVLPLYMINKAPLLPTYDCYDSDEENKESQIEKPTWINREHMSEAMKLMGNINERFKNTFFCLKPQTPDLRQIFQNIDPKKLKRNSSAVWSHQPRFTIMPSLSEEDY